VLLLLLLLLMVMMEKASVHRLAPIGQRR